MATIKRVVVAWNGLSGLPGYSVLYADAATDPTGPLATFFNAIKAQFPSPLTWTVPSSGDTIDALTGTLNGQWTGTGGTTVAASTSGAYVAGTGAFVRLGTGVILNGRRLKGRLFLAPLKNDQFDTGGRVSAAALAILQPAVTALVGANVLTVWHRPHPHGTSTGASATVTSGTVPTSVTSLRSRRV